MSYSYLVKAFAFFSPSSCWLYMTCSGETPLQRERESHKFRKHLSWHNGTLNCEVYLSNGNDVGVAVYNIYPNTLGKWIQEECFDLSF